MLSYMIALGFTILVVIGPLLWRGRRDRRADEALRLQAALQRKADQRLGGETFLVVTVRPRHAGGRGRVVLSAPAGWQWLIQEAWNDVRRAMPEGYELVVSGGGGREDTAPRPWSTAPAGEAAPAGRAG
jgi:hypothetical protein